jgi:hypothetical protein
MDASITHQQDPEIYLKMLEANKLNFYVTYEKSFLSAKLVDEMSSSITALASSSLPVMAGAVAQKMVEQVCSEIANYATTDGTN